MRIERLLVEIKNVNKIYGGTNHVVKNLNLDVYEGEFLTLFRFFRLWKNYYLENDSRV